MLVQPWPKLSKTPAVMHLKELVQKLRQMEKDSFFDQALSDNEEYRQELNNQL